MVGAAVKRPEVTRRSVHLETMVAAFLVVLPAMIFYWILFRQVVNIPDQDDYSVLEFLNTIAALRGFPAKLYFFLVTQHNEYKIFFEHALVWAQYDLQGHIDFRVLCAIGNGFILLLGILLWKMFLPEYKNLTSRLIFFIPVSWLLFQLQYAELMVWAMPSLQHLPSLFSR